MNLKNLNAPSTTDMIKLMNSQKINDSPNNDLDEMDDIMNNDMINNFNNNNSSDNDDSESLNDFNDLNDLNDNNDITKEHKSFSPRNLSKAELKELVSPNNDEYENLSPQLQKLKKYKLLTKLAELGKKEGNRAYVTSDYNMDDDYYAIKLEYDFNMGLRSEKRTIESFYEGTIGISKFLELLNNKFNNPFGVSIDGFSFNLQASREELLEVYEELYDKYNPSGRGSSPEAQLCIIIIKAFVTTIINNTAGSYLSSLYGNSITEKDKEDIKNKINNNQYQQQNYQSQTSYQNQFNQPININLSDEKIHKGDGVMKQYQDEINNRKLTPPIMPDSLK